MNPSKWANGTVNRSPASSAGIANADLLAAITGKQASRDRAVAQTTRRVVLTSLGVLDEQQAGRRRSRALALAALLVALLAVGPFVWHVTEEMIGGERLADVTTQTSLWLTFLCPAVLAAVLVAGWAHSRRD